MQSCWDILEVEQDANLRTIKRAYAKKLKAIRQDENPLAFLELREAYEEARAYEGSTAPISTFDPTLSFPNLFEEPFEPILSNVEQLLAQVDTLMASTTDRNKVENWKTIFNTLEHLSLDEHTNFELNFIYQVQNTCHSILNSKYASRRNIRYIPHVMNAESGRFIFEQFGWNNSQSTIHFSEEIRDLRNMLNAHTKETRLARQKEEEEVNGLTLEDGDDSMETLWLLIKVVIFGAIIFRVITRIGNGNGYY